MRDAVVEFEFEEIGILIDGADVGMFAGSASIDQDGNVVGLTLDAYITDRTKPVGVPKKIYRYLSVPLKHKTMLSFTERLAREIATSIETGFEPEINDLLNDWSVSIAEETFERQSPIADAFEDIRRDLRELAGVGE